MAKVEIEFPNVPTASDETAIIQSLGRLTMAWSSSEYYLAFLLLRLMASAKLETKEQFAKAAAGDADMVVDHNAVFALYFAVESSRGRRDLVSRLADARVGEGYLSKNSYDEIRDLLADHAQIAKSRNRYAHGAMGRRRDDGAYILMDKKVVISRADWTARLKNPQVRANNNRVDAKQIDEVVDRIGDWITRALGILRGIESRPTVGS